MNNFFLSLSVLEMALGLGLGSPILGTPVLSSSDESPNSISTTHLATSLLSSGVSLTSPAVMYPSTTPAAVTSIPIPVTTTSSNATLPSNMTSSTPVAPATSNRPSDKPWPAPGDNWGYMSVFSIVSFVFATVALGLVALVLVGVCVLARTSVKTSEECSIAFSKPEGCFHCPGAGGRAAGRNLLEVDNPGLDRDERNGVDMNPSGFHPLEMLQMDPATQN